MDKFTGALLLIGGIGCIGTFMVGILVLYVLYGLRSLGVYSGDPIDAVVPKVLAIIALFWCFAAFGWISLVAHG